MAGQEKRQRHGKSEYQDQKRIDPQHHDQGTEDHDGTGAGLDQILRHGSVDGINIIGNVADDIAGLVLVKKTDRESHQMAEYVRAHLLDDLLAEADQSPGQQPFKQGRDSVAGKHHTTVEKDLWKFHIAFSVDGIDGHTRKLGTCQSFHRRFKIWVVFILGLSAIPFWNAGPPPIIRLAFMTGPPF